MAAPIQRYTYIMIRSDLLELPNIITTQGQLGYRLMSIINTVDSSDLNHQQYYSVWELPV